MITKTEIEAITSVEVFITYRHEMGWGVGVGREVWEGRDICITMADAC